MLPAAAWAVLFGGLLLPADPGGYDLTVLQHNVSDENPDPAGTARALAQAGADLIALEELTPAALPVYEAALASGLSPPCRRGHRRALVQASPRGRPAGGHQAEGVGADWSRGLRATVRGPSGDVAVYVAHLPSVRIGLPNGFGSGRRDESAAALGAAVAAEKLDRVILLGDLNGTLDDRGLAPVISRMNPAEEGFGFSWPAALPLARIDQVMTRSATPVTTWALPATGSDHLPIAARIKIWP